MIRWLNRLQPWGLCLLRVVLGVTMTCHGFEKIIPTGGLHRNHLLAGFEQFESYIATFHLPRWLGAVSILTEFLGGLCLVAGCLTRLAAFFVTINMLVALVLVGIHQDFGIYSYISELAAIAFLLILTGSGALSLDRRFGLS